ncbi:hypothetical protein BM1_10881 [Bipolaris maydis]|nr:hypothetical protein BM1_10875 [Bipolaris maydis]KAH7548715.1 hypothetical protein BM1_10881 [Bipolaris maydis]
MNVPVKANLDVNGPSVRGDDLAKIYGRINPQSGTEQVSIENEEQKLLGYLLRRQPLATTGILSSSETY